jgi:hypothetical protein
MLASYLLVANASRYLREITTIANTDMVQNLTLQPQTPVPYEHSELFSWLILALALAMLCTLVWQACRELWAISPPWLGETSAHLPPSALHEFGDRARRAIGEAT